MWISFNIFISVTTGTRVLSNISAYISRNKIDIKVSTIAIWILDSAVAHNDLKLIATLRKNRWGEFSFISKSWPEQVFLQLSIWLNGSTSSTWTKYKLDGNFDFFRYETDWMQFAL